MAALRHGIKTVIIPKENEKDLSEIDQTVRRALNFILAEHVDSVIEATLVLPEEETTADATSEKPAIKLPQQPKQKKRELRQ